MKNSVADIVVYGKIFTSEGNQIVEAFAVKDGKFIYVGDKAGANAFIEDGKTEIIDYTGKGSRNARLRQRSRSLFFRSWCSQSRHSH